MLQKASYLMNFLFTDCTKFFFLTNMKKKIQHENRDSRKYWNTTYLNQQIQGDLMWSVFFLMDTEWFWIKLDVFVLIPCVLLRQWVGSWLSPVIHSPHSVQAADHLLCCITQRHAYGHNGDKLQSRLKRLCLLCGIKLYQVNKHKR